MGSSKVLLNTFLRDTLWTLAPPKFPFLIFLGVFFVPSKIFEKSVACKSCVLAKPAPAL